MMEALIDRYGNLVIGLSFGFFHYLIETFQFFEVELIKSGSGVEPYINFTISNWLFFEELSNLILIADLFFIFVGKLKAMISPFKFSIVL